MDESTGEEDENNNNTNGDENSENAGGEHRSNKNENNQAMFKCLIVTGHNDSTTKIWNENFCY